MITFNSLMFNVNEFFEKKKTIITIAFEIITTKLIKSIVNNSTKTTKINVTMFCKRNKYL